MINQIKEALEKAEDGPWYVEKNEVWTTREDHEGYKIQICKAVPCTMAQKNLHLIANTPTYLRYLLDELEKADTEIAKYHKLHDDGYNEIRILTEQYEKAKASVFMWSGDRDKWKAEAEKQLQLFNEEFETARKYMEERDQLRIEHTTMKEALEFYAAETTYDIVHLSKRGFMIIDQDSGKRAISALSTLTKEESHE